MNRDTISAMAGLFSQLKRGAHTRGVAPRPAICTNICQNRHVPREFTLSTSSPHDASSPQPSPPSDGGEGALVAALPRCELSGLRLRFRRPLLVIFAWLSVSLVAWATSGPKAKPEFERARVLATKICAVCHLFPEPETLDRYTWTNHVKPLMRISMGVVALENNPSPDARTLMEQWNAIWEDYYAVAAPEMAPPQDPRPPIVPDLGLFKVEDPKYEVTNGYATMIQIDSEAHQIYVGNAIKKCLDVLDSQGRLLASSPVDTTLTHLLKRPEGWLGTQIGIVPPNDLPLGLVTLYDRKENRFEKRCDLLTGLLRSV